MSLFRNRSLRVALLAGLAALAAALAAGVAFAARVPAADAGVVLIETNLEYEGAAAAGTGMVITPSGDVLTNNHVIQGATTIKVTIPQTHRTYTATVAGYAISADVALLRLKGASGLATVKLGDSSTLKVGARVRAVGNAQGQGFLTAVSGAVTGLRRSITASDGNGAGERLTGLVRTTAPLQPGDSGGPLYDASGRVVGMNTAASQGFSFTSTGASAFAVPINKARAIVKQIESGRSTATVHVGGTPFLGVSVAAARDYGYGYGYGDATSSGPVVAEVVPNSPADRLGLTQGDTITAVDGARVLSPKEIVSRLLKKAPGKKVTISWIDGLGTSHTGSVALASGPPQ